MNKEEYKKAFSGKSTASEKHVEALKFALDTRKFEIELYWKRATYFWAFIAVTFAFYGLVQRVPSPEKEFLSFTVSCLGLVLSVGWLFANRGSKQWQENWEHHVDHLENEVMGPLYKVTMPRSTPKGIFQWIDFVFVGPSKHSVSKINQLISSFISALWFILVARQPVTWNLKTWGGSELAVLGVTALCLALIMLLARTHSGPHTHKPKLRESKIEESAKDS